MSVQSWYMMGQCRITETVDIILDAVCEREKKAKDVKLSCEDNNPKIR